MKNKIKKVFFDKIGIFILGILLCVGIQIASAWKSPTSSPPDGNVAGPLTTGVGDQVKAGGNIELANCGSLYAGGKVVAPEICIGADCRFSWPEASILNNAVATNHIVDGTITSNDVNINSIQQRISESCGSGSAIREITNTGSVVCENFSGGGGGGSAIPSGLCMIADTGVNCSSGWTSKSVSGIRVCCKN